jgi:molybdate transport system regulatory protein
MTSSIADKRVSTGLVPHVKVWLDVDGQVALSDWQIGLLERIDACGSLAEAARQLDIPYQTARYKLREMQSALGGQVLMSYSGGASRGGTQLTERARDAIRRYHRVTDGLEELIAERFAASFSDF